MFRSGIGFGGLELGCARQVSCNGGGTFNARYGAASGSGGCCVSRYLTRRARGFVGGNGIIAGLAHHPAFGTVCCYGSL